MISAVLDTNVLVAGLSSRNGASYQIMNAAEKGLFTPLLSVPLFLEYESVLTRPAIMKLTGLSHKSVQDFLDTFILLSRKVNRIWFLWRPLLRDPKDDMLVECALAGGAEYLVTFDIGQFAPLEKTFSFQTLTSSNFLKILRGGE